MRTIALGLAGMTAVAAVAAAASGPSPYAGFADRPIRALSAEQIGDLRAGRGMGLALAAELNGWPGPVHVLELADGIGLSAEQRRRTQALFERMQAEARRLGERLIAEEIALDAAFRDRSIDKAVLLDRLRGIGSLQAELRAVHLGAHLEQVGLLTQDQVAAYTRLRGYTESTGSGPSRPASPPTPHRGHGAP